MTVPMPLNDEEWLTPGEAHELTGITTKTLASWADRHLLTVKTTAGGHRRYLRQQLVAYVEDRQRVLPPLDQPWRIVTAEEVVDVHGMVRVRVVCEAVPSMAARERGILYLAQQVAARLTAPSYLTFHAGAADDAEDA